MIICWGVVLEFYIGKNGLIRIERNWGWRSLNGVVVNGVFFEEIWLEVILKNFSFFFGMEKVIFNDWLCKWWSNCENCLEVVVRIVELCNIVYYYCFEKFFEN